MDTPTMSARQAYKRVLTLWRIQWTVVFTTIATVIISVDFAMYALAVGAVAAGLITLIFLNSKVHHLYRDTLDPCHHIHVNDLVDVALLVDYYTTSAKGPEAVRRPWLPPLTMKRMLKRRAGNPFWAPLGNVALSSRVSAQRSTCIMPFLTQLLLDSPRDSVSDDIAIAAVNLRSLWSADIIRQENRDQVQQQKASEAWLLLGL